MLTELEQHQLFTQSFFEECSRANMEPEAAGELWRVAMADNIKQAAYGIEDIKTPAYFDNQAFQTGSIAHTARGQQLSAYKNHLRQLDAIKPPQGTGLADYAARHSFKWGEGRGERQRLERDYGQLLNETMRDQRRMQSSASKARANLARQESKNTLKQDAWKQIYQTADQDTFAGMLRRLQLRFGGEGMAQRRLNQGSEIRRGLGLADRLRNMQLLPQ